MPSAYFLFLLLTLSSSSSAVNPCLHSFVFIEGEGFVRIKHKRYWKRLKGNIKITKEVKENNVLADSMTLHKIRLHKYRPAVNVCIVSVTLICFSVEHHHVHHECKLRQSQKLCLHIHVYIDTKFYKCHM